MAIITLQSALNKAVKDLGLEEKVIEAKIEKIWADLFDEKIAKIHKLDKGILYLQTYSSTWRYELDLRKESIAEELNQKLGKNSVRKIIVK